MKRKKQFVTPKVLQEVQVQLETNLLGDLLGHENIATTRIYLRKSSLEQRTLIDQIVDW